MTEPTTTRHNLYYENTTDQRPVTMILEAALIHQARQKARLWVVSMNAAAGRTKFVLGEWERGTDDYGAFGRAGVTGDGVEVGRFTIREVRE
jgi:hypothetical protein